MKRLFSLVFLNIFFFSLSYAQSTERFIRIVGNASHTFDSKATVLNFTVSEVAPNEYKQVRYKPIDQTYTEFVTEINKIGFTEGQLERAAGNISKYAKTISRSYSIETSDQSKMDALATINIPGVQLSKVNYKYQFDDDVAQKLALSAIDDAKRKGANICSEIDMKLGKILNIEDTSGDCCSDVIDSKEPTLKKSYKVKVTFELID